MAPVLWVIAVLSTITVIHKAIGREKQLKDWARAKKIALIDSKNPRWEDFSEKWGTQMAFAGEAIRGR
jgi:predicted GIY-YIG superfamily endonuclease